MRHLSYEVQPDRWMILVVESWLICAKKFEYIAIDNTPLWPGLHVDGRLRLARPDQSACQDKLKS